MMVDNNDNKFVDASCSLISSENIINEDGVLCGYDQTFKVGKLNDGYHRIKSIAFNTSSSVVTGSKPSVYDTIKVRVSQLREIPEKTNIPINKVFTIQFTKPVQIDENTKKYVKVYDNNDKEVPVSVGKGPDASSICIYPNNNYKPGIKYSIMVNPGLKSTDGQELFKCVRMSFITESGSSLRKMGSLPMNNFEKSTIRNSAEISEHADIEIDF